MPDYFRGVNAVAVVTVGERQCGLATILDLEGNVTFGEGTATLRRDTRRLIAEGRVALLGLSPNVRGLFEMTRLVDVFDVYEDEPSALRGMSGGRG